ncbi:MAG: hypothetical protein KatS3mg111_2854 [Pirellulaceae bacterium]|nr:MAG: hypothetical protein KatS3mg111_2854 [Pirellulaceae bacterium]
MVSTPEQRRRGLQVLKNPAAYSDTEVHNAVLDVRRRPEPGDEKLLLPLLEHADAMVVAAVLYSLTHVYGTVEQYRDLIMKLAQGDPRDCMEMPIQSSAISDLAELAQHDREALDLLRRIAEDSGTAEVPRQRAWFCLAGLFNVPWSKEDSEAMIWDPDSQRSEQAKARVREAAEGLNWKPVQPPRKYFV